MYIMCFQKDTKIYLIYRGSDLCNNNKEKEHEALDTFFKFPIIITATVF